MDLADQADAVSELFRAIRLREAKAAADRPVPSASECLNCGAVTKGARWCSPECRDDHLRREARTTEGP